MSLNNDFRTSRRTYNEKGGFFGSYTGVDALYPSAGVYSINTSGRILSAGVDLFSIFNISSVYSVVNTNSASWNSVYSNVNTTSASWSSVYSNVNTNSASWSSVYSNVNTTSAGLINTIYTAGTQGSFNYTKLSGAGVFPVLLDNLGTGGNPTFNNLTVSGNLSVLGDLTFLNTTVSVTSALSVVNAGTGPALYVKQDGNNPIAYFVDANGTGDIIFADNGFVGLGTGSSVFNPGARLTVNGNISASGGATLSGAILRNLNQTSTATGNRIVTVEADGTLTYDSLANGASLIDGIGLVTNRLTKSTSISSTLSASTIIDTGSSVQLDRNISFIQAAPDAFTTSADAPILRQVFTNLSISTSTIQVSTFPLSTSYNGNNVVLMYTRYNVLLYNTSNNARTAYEIAAVNTTTGGAVSGTIYGIIDSQAVSLLADSDLINPGLGGSLILTISSTNIGTRTIIEGMGYYTAP